MAPLTMKRKCVKKISFLMQKAILLRKKKISTGLMEKLLFSVISLSFTPVLLSQSRGIDYYLDQALRNSPLLKDYQHQVLTNQLDSQRIRAAYKPQVTGTSNNTYAPVINGFGYDYAI